MARILTPAFSSSPEVHNSSSPTGAAWTVRGGYESGLPPVVHLPKQNAQPVHRFTPSFQADFQTWARADHPSQTTQSTLAPATPPTPTTRRLPAARRPDRPWLQSACSCVIFSSPPHHAVEITPTGPESFRQTP